jgi:hypothetical protein
VTDFLSRPRRFRFSLRGVLLALTAICLFLGWGLSDALRTRRIEREARAMVAARGGRIQTNGSSSAPHFDDGRLARLLGLSGHRRPLWTVDLTGAPVTAEDLATLVRCRWIRTLHLSDTPIGDEEVKLIAQLPELRILIANNTRITDAGLARLHRLRYLARLDVGSTQVTYDGLGKLDDALGVRRFAAAHAAANGPFAGVTITRRIETLEAPDGDYSEYIIGRPIRHLTIFDLSHFDPACWAHLTQMSDVRDLKATFEKRPLPGLENVAKFRELRALAIVGLLTDRDMTTIAQLPKLRYLFLAGPHKLTDDAMLSFGENHVLEKLELHGNELTIDITARLSGLHALRILALHFWLQGPDGKYGELSPAQSAAVASALARLKDYPQLRSVRLWGNAFGDEAILGLGEATQLTEIIYGNDAVGPETVASLQSTLPNCRISPPPVNDSIDLD